MYTSNSNRVVVPSVLLEYCTPLDLDLHQQKRINLRMNNRLITHKIALIRPVAYRTIISDPTFATSNCYRSGKEGTPQAYIHLF